MLKISPIGDLIIELTEIDSTNNYAMRLINEGMAEHGMVVRADFQTHGKGQHGNLWMAEESKNLLISVILDTQGIAIESQFMLNVVACLSVTELLTQVYKFQDVSIKWPNDIYAGKQKIAGILIENQIRGSQWSHAVMGIGLNVNQMNFHDLNRATSMALCCGKSFKINQVLKQFIKLLNSHFARILSQDSTLLFQYNQQLMHIGSEIHYRKNFEYFKGSLQGVTEQGLIQILTERKLKSFIHKEIELILE
jgi:BirA family biotin operon repressor/biotin-[acetyl-CoA-carboxylase] ligase